MRVGGLFLLALQRQFRGRPLQEDGQRGLGDEERHQLLERLGRRQEEQDRPNDAAQHGRGGQGRDRRAWPRSSGRDALTEPTLLRTRATVLVMLAVTGGRPVASSAG